MDVGGSVLWEMVCTQTHMEGWVVGDGNRAKKLYIHLFGECLIQGRINTLHCVFLFKLRDGFWSLHIQRADRQIHGQAPAALGWI